MQRPIQSLLVTLILSIATSFPTLAAEDTIHPAAQVVLDFNKGITTRNMEISMPLLADGAVQYNLHPAHPGMSDDQPLTEDMAASWTTVSALLFAMTESYVRNIEVLNVQVQGELAVVWTQTRTVTRTKDKDEPMVLDFSEMYFLVNKDGTGWRIAGTATNRPVDDIAIG